jgi:hypothetical protein
VTTKRKPQKRARGKARDELAACVVIPFPKRGIWVCRPDGVKAEDIEYGRAESENLASLGVPEGSVLVGRKPRPGERPPVGAVCVFMAGGEKIALRVARLTRRSVYLQDDCGTDRFDLEEVQFVAVGQYVCTCEMRGGRLCQRSWLAPSPWREVDALDWPEVIAG